MHRISFRTLLAALLGCAGFLALIPSAVAFSGSQHESVTSDACEKAGMPGTLCRRVAVEARNVDGNEWDDPLAHAQMPEGVAACTAAGQVAGRMQSLGNDFRAAVLSATTTSKWYEREAKAEEAAVALGRAMHTLQDDLAHEGMNNPEHAWYSLTDLCTGSKLAPDSRADALERAKTQSQAFLQAVAATLSAEEIAMLDSNACPGETSTENPSPQAPCQQNISPWLSDVCTFLADSKKWDGTDRRWNVDLVAPALPKAFLDGTVPDFCSMAEIDVSKGDKVDVSGGIPTCTKAHLACFGKVDETPAADDAAVQDAGGCATAPGSEPSAHRWLALALLAVIAGRCRLRVL
jgi:hypothetical protein